MHTHSSSLAHPRHAVSVAHPERARCALHCLRVSILLMVSGGATGWGPVAPACSQLCAANCSSGAREPRVFGLPLTCTYLALAGPRSRPTQPAHDHCRECHTWHWRAVRGMLCMTFMAAALTRELELRESACITDSIPVAVPYKLHKILADTFVCAFAVPLPGCVVLCCIHVARHVNLMSGWTLDWRCC